LYSFIMMKKVFCFFNSYLNIQQGRAASDTTKVVSGDELRFRAIVNKGAAP
jgi:hypothetical protein